MSAKQVPNDRPTGKSAVNRQTRSKAAISCRCRSLPAPGIHACCERWERIRSHCFLQALTSTANKAAPGAADGRHKQWRDGVRLERVVAGAFGAARRGLTLPVAPPIM